MPWEKKFDLDDATDKAIRVFWKKGYEATSLSDLITGMGINKGSLYNAFGSKKALFDRALLRYDQTSRQRAFARLAEVADGREAIIMLFDGLVAESEGDTDHPGCMLVNTALELPMHGEDVREKLVSVFAELSAFFKHAIETGQDQGTIPGSFDVEQLAKFLVSSVVGLRVLARGTFHIEEIKAIRDAVVTVISHPDVR